MSRVKEVTGVERRRNARRDEAGENIVFALYTTWLRMRCQEGRLHLRECDQISDLSHLNGLYTSLLRGGALSNLGKWSFQGLSPWRKSECITFSLPPCSMQHLIVGIL